MAAAHGIDEFPDAATHLFENAGHFVIINLRGPGRVGTIREQAPLQPLIQPRPARL